MDSRKSNRKHKKDRKKKKRRHKSSSSSDSSSSEDEWVEASSVSQNPTSKKREEDTQTTAVRKEEDNNEWASFSEQFRTRQEIQEKRKPKDKEERVNILDKPGQSARELNPYWADGGSGLPEVEKVRQGGVTSCAVGDFGLDWMRRSLRRAKEQAEEERRSLEDVVAERWGSLAKLESLIAEAEEKQIKNSRYKSRHEDDDKRYRRRNDDKDNFSSRRNRFAKPKNESSDEEVGRNYQSRKTDEYDKWKKEKNKKGFAKPRDDDDEEEEEAEGDYRSRRKDKFNDKDEDDKWKQRKSFAKPRDDVEEGRGYRSRKTDKNDDEVYDKWKKEKNKKGFARPRDDEEGEARERRREEEDDGRRREERDWRRSGGWRKKKEEDSRRRDVEEEKDTKRTERESCGSSGGWRKKTSDTEKDDDEDVDKVGNTSSGHSVTSSQEESKQDGGHVTSAVLTADERNELAAKLVKAEIMGNTSLAAELRSRLEAAREAAAAPERVLLTVTDRRGFTQPLEAPKRGAADADRGRKRPKKAATHDESGQRVRYFADDDRFTLQEMFEREKRNTAEDQNEMFARLAGKKIGSDESARDMDDVFEETAAARGGDARQVARDEERHRARAISQHQRAARAHDSCHWCLESQHLLKHLVVAVGSKVYLCLPPYESLTEGHCLIVTSQHVTCCVQADEEVWEEIQVFRKALVDLFLSQDMDCVLFEHAAGFAKFPHLVVHCVPLPKEQGDLAPIYFKKAILECETEWSTNKKLIDLAGKNVRRCVPRGLPYFFVDFGMQAGYAHVIEDEQLFPRNFAQEIIGGILDVDHSKWRKPRREKFDDQRKKVVEFTKLWKPFDFTKKSSD